MPSCQLTENLFRYIYWIRAFKFGAQWAGPGTPALRQQPETLAISNRNARHEHSLNHRNAIRHLVSD